MSLQSLWRQAACILLVSALTSQAYAQARSKPDLSGVWVRPGTGRNADGTQAHRVTPATQHSSWTTESLSFTPEGRKAFDANIPIAGPRQVKSELSNDPRDHANPVGLYRMIASSGNGRAFEIHQHDDRIYMLFSYGRNWRIIYTDGRPVEEHPIGPFWFGSSFGKWEGDTLVITTLDLDDRQWLDGWGTPISMDARVTERWRRVGDKVEFSFTVNDPTYYTKPWHSETQTFALQAKQVQPVEMITAPADITEYNNTLLIPSSNKAGSSAK
jgi:hypothetical protein